MKFFAVVAALAVAAFAQQIEITAPDAGSNISPGQSITVTVARPNSLTSSQEISVAVAILPCPDSGCGGTDVSQDLGNILLSGPYTPQLIDPTKPESQSFSLRVPDSIATGPASLNVAHFSLVGAASVPTLEVKNITLNVVAPASGRRSAMFKRSNNLRV